MEANGISAAAAAKAKRYESRTACAVGPLMPRLYPAGVVSGRVQLDLVREAQHGQQRLDHGRVEV